VGKLNMVSSDPAEVIPGSDMVLIAAPANAHPSLLSTVAPHCDPGVILGSIFAQGGFDWAAKQAFGDLFGNIGVLFGFQNIPWICKMTEYGKSGKIIGPKKGLYVATYPVEENEAIAEKMSVLWDIPCKTLPNFLNLTLTPSNQIIHPARYFSIFQDWDGVRTYTKEELGERNGLTLYKDMDANGAEIMQKADNELQQVRLALVQRFPQLDLSMVMPMAERIVHQYGEDVSDTSSLQAVFQTNRGYAGCGTPLTEVASGQFTPAVGSRLFWEDIPFGLCILKCLAEMLGNFPTPTIDFLIRWHQQFMGKEFLSADGQLNPMLLSETGCPYKYGIHSIEDLVGTCLHKDLANYKHPRSRL